MRTLERVRIEQLEGAGDVFVVAHSSWCRTRACYTEYLLARVIPHLSGIVHPERNLRMCRQNPDLDDNLHGISNTHRPDLHLVHTPHISNKQR